MLHKQQDTLGRRNRMKPKSTGKRIRLTDRDLLWFQKIHEHGPLTTSELLAFSDGGEQNIGRAKNRLTDLFNEDNTNHSKRYLHRPPKQFQTIDARYNELIYTLTETGKQALKEAGLWSDWVHHAGGPFWHQRMTAQITAGIEIETLSRTNLNFIPGWKVLERAETKLRYPTTFIDPHSGKTITKDLIPDALFGIEYLTGDGPRYRFYLVEADRSTEPKTSPNMHRKSLQRTLLQYEDYLERGKYREHLGLKAPLVAVLCTTAKIGISIAKPIDISVNSLPFDASVWLDSWSAV